MGHPANTYTHTHAGVSTAYTRHHTKLAPRRAKPAPTTMAQPTPAHRPAEAPTGRRSGRSGRPPGRAASGRSGGATHGPSGTGPVGPAEAHTGPERAEGPTTGRPVGRAVPAEERPAVGPFGPVRRSGRDAQPRAERRRAGPSGRSGRRSGQAGRSVRPRAGPRPGRAATGEGGVEDVEALDLGPARGPRGPHGQGRTELPPPPVRPSLS